MLSQSISHYYGYYMWHLFFNYGILIGELKFTTFYISIGIDLGTQGFTTI